MRTGSVKTAAAPVNGRTTSFLKGKSRVHDSFWGLMLLVNDHRGRHIRRVRMSKEICFLLMFVPLTILSILM